MGIYVGSEDRLELFSVRSKSTLVFQVYSSYLYHSYFNYMIHLYIHVRKRDSRKRETVAGNKKLYGLKYTSLSK